MDKPELVVGLLEDDADQAAIVAQWVEEAGYAVRVFRTAGEFRRRQGAESIDLLLLDWMLPDTAGIDVLGWIRASGNSRLPVIFLTARDAEEDLVRALASGGDDYVVKPPKRGELLARVNALLRRAYPQKESGEFVIDRYRFDPAKAQIHIGEQTVVLKQKEFDLAVFLFRNIGRLLSRKHLLEAVWSMEAEVSSRSLDTHVSRLRSKLGINPENGYRLVAIYSVGYRLETVSPGVAVTDSRFAAGVPHAA